MYGLGCRLEDLGFRLEDLVCAGFRVYSIIQGGGGREGHAIWDFEFRTWTVSDLGCFKLA